jgi:hypothetical protein
MKIRSLLVLLIGAPALFAALPVLAAVPCCGIVNIAATGLVTAREEATGRTFEFQVSDPRLLATLTIGRAVYADFTTRQVSVEPDGGQPCCGIVSAATGTSAARAAAVSGVRLPAVQSAGPFCIGVEPGAWGGRLGRVVVAYPAKVPQARLDVFRSGQTTSIAGGYGDMALDLLPGTYDVKISGKLISGVTVQSGHDTQVKVGVLHVRAAANTRIDLFEPLNGIAITGAYGEHLFGLPIGEVSVQVAGGSETVAIVDGQITEF